MTQELRHEYLRAIQEKDNQISRTSAALEDEKQRVSKITYAEAEAHFGDLQLEVDKLILEKANINIKTNKPRDAAGLAPRA